MKKYYFKSTRLNILIGKSRKARSFNISVFLLLTSALIAFAFTWGSNYNLLTNTSVYWPAATLAKPNYLQTVTDPVFGTKITRISGDPGLSVPNGLPGQVWNNVSRHHYSLDQAWNADQSLLLLSKNQTDGTMIFLNGETYTVQFTRASWSGVADFRWDPTNASRMVYINGTELGYWNPTTNVKTIINDFGATGGTCYFGPSKGNLSNDGRFMVIKRDSVAFLYDIVNKIKYADITLPSDFGATDGSAAMVSPLSSYIVFATATHTYVYTWNGVYLHTWPETSPSHYDFAVDSDSSEVLVGGERAHPNVNEGKVIKRRLADGVITPLTTGGYVIHSSARNLNRNGWTIASEENTSPGWDPYYSEIDAAKLDGSRVERICHIYSNATSYDGEPQASPSPDGGRVIFASNWNSGSNTVIQAYVADFRDKIISNNLVINPGFENGTTGWTIDYGSDSVVTSNIHSGLYCLQAGGTGSASGRAQEITSGFSVGDSLTISGWGKVSTTTLSGLIGVDCINSSGSTIVEVSNSFSTTSYQNLSLSFAVPPGTVSLKVFVYKGASTSYFYADDISLTHISTGTMAVKHTINSLKSEEPSIETGEHVKIYPNPSDNYIIVDANLHDSKVQMSILDIQGKAVWAQSYENREGHFNEKVNVNNLPSGIYILKIFEKGHVTTKKFTVK